MKHEDAASRVRQRIEAWTKEQGHGSKKRLADAVRGLYGVQRSGAWATDVVRGRQDLRLRDLDAVADEMGVAPGDLVRRNDRQYVELTTTEMRLLRYFRALPDVIRGHLMAYLDYLYAPHERELHDQAEQVRRRTDAARAEHRERRKA